MSYLAKQPPARHDSSPEQDQQGFTILEFIVSMTVMLLVLAAIFSLLKSSMKVATTTYEVTDAQQNLRTAQEFINRDLMNAGDGLESIITVRVPLAFMSSYITLTPGTPSAGTINMGIFTSDNNLPVGTPVTGSVPAMTIRTASDRQTILEVDPAFTAVSPTTIDPTGSTMTLPDSSPSGFAMVRSDGSAVYTKGEIYFLTSSDGGTFGTITTVNPATRQLSFATNATDDPYGLNLTGNGGHIKTISASGTVATSLQRMRIIQYYVSSTGLLMRRVFGVQGAGFRESIIAEHVVDVQFNYSLITADALGNVTPSTTTALLPAQQVWVRQVEVRVTVETPHATQLTNVNGSPITAHKQMTMTTSTSVRNMQFRQAL
jgi:Tfp pilus assembly protein PilW